MPSSATVELDAALASSFDAPPAAIVVKGYLDAIALSDVGVRNVVASMGTEMRSVPGGELCTFLTAMNAIDIDII